MKSTKSVSGWGSAPGPAGGAYSAPPDPLAGLGRGLGEEEREGRGRGEFGFLALPWPTQPEIPGYGPVNNLSDFANFGELQIFWGVGGAGKGAPGEGAPNGSLRPGRQKQLATPLSLPLAIFIYTL